jgi:hypothetical protein
MDYQLHCTLIYGYAEFLLEYKYDTGVWIL